MASLERYDTLSGGVVDVVRPSGNRPNSGRLNTAIKISDLRDVEGAKSSAIGLITNEVARNIVTNVETNYDDMSHTVVASYTPPDQSEAIRELEACVAHLERVVSDKDTEILDTMENVRHLDSIIAEMRKKEIHAD